MCEAPPTVHHAFMIWISFLEEPRGGFNGDCYCTNKDPQEATSLSQAGLQASVEAEMPGKGGSLGPGSQGVRVLSCRW